jgi:hypothetical protein
MFSTKKHSRSVFVFFIEVIVNQMNYIKLSIFPKLLVQLEPKLIGVEPLLRQRLRTKSNSYILAEVIVNERKLHRQTQSQRRTHSCHPENQRKSNKVFNYNKIYSYVILFLRVLSKKHKQGKKS